MVCALDATAPFSGVVSAGAAFRIFLSFWRYLKLGGSICLVVIMRNESSLVSLNLDLSSILISFGIYLYIIHGSAIKRFLFIGSTLAFMERIKMWVHLNQLFLQYRGAPVCFSKTYFNENINQSIDLLAPCVNIHICRRIAINFM